MDPGEPPCKGGRVHASTLQAHKFADQLTKLHGVARDLERIRREREERRRRYAKYMDE